MPETTEMTRAQFGMSSGRPGALLRPAPLRTGLATFTASGSSKHVKILCRRHRTSCSMVCQSIADQSAGPSSGPFNTATPDNDADAGAAKVVVVMLSNLSFGSGSLSVFLHRLT
jgi:hypothetical protein